MGNLVDDKELLMVIKEMFLGYEDRKKNNSLYNYDRDLPKLLIKLYYDLSEGSRSLDELQDNFIKHYIECECILEDTHEPFEKEGLKVMYEYIHSTDIDYRFDIYTLLELHRRLYSKFPYDVGGVIRNATARIKDAPVDLTPYYEIRYELNALDDFLKEIIELGKTVKDKQENIFEYIEKCIVLKCKLIKTHPFFDGNGRSIRGFINKLFLDVGLPSVYISANENVQYRAAMQKAIGEENDMHSIIQFYYYKICDSIFELDIYPKLNTENFNLPQRIMGLVRGYTESLGKEDLNRDLNKQICDELVERLNALGIYNDRYCTTQFSENVVPHDFILVYYKNKDNNRLIIDPMFACLEKAGKISTKRINPALKNAYSNLVQNGFASISNLELSEYIDLFNEYVAEPKQLAVIKRPSKRSTQS